MARRWRNLFLAIVFSYLFLIFMIFGIARVFDDDNREVAEGGVVGIVFYDDSEPERLARVLRGVERLRQREEYQLFFVGGWRPSCKYVGSELMRDVAVSLGSDPRRLASDNRSNDTYSNVENAIGMIPNGVSGIEVISDSFHLARIGLIIRWLGYSGSVKFIPAKQSYSLLQSWRRANHELLGYLSLLVPRQVAQPLIIRYRSGFCVSVSPNAQAHD
jgi:uncharacterized SAM-binding protein YcdF (DUF218 family)